MTKVESFWDYPEHSRYKHEILKKYLPAFRKITKAWRNFIYVDGFAGSGKYNDGSDGSPILAIKELNKLHNKEKTLPNYCRTTCIFIEANGNNFEKLRKNIQDVGNYHKNISIECYKGKFEIIYSDIKKKFNDLFQKCPILFFLDPFGYNQIPFSILKDIFTFNKPEIILIFMVDFIRRFYKDQLKSGAYERLFGSPDWKEDFEKNYSQIKDKIDAFSIYYRDLLIKAGAKFTIQYKIKHEKTNQRFYDIIHATTHIKGFKVMKNIMFNMGIEGTFEFHGKREKELKKHRKITDYMGVDPDVEKLKKWLKKNIRKDKLYTFKELSEIIYIRTFFIEKTLRKCLQEMERKGSIIVERITSKTKRGLSGEDQIRFI